MTRISGLFRIATSGARPAALSGSAFAVPQDGAATAAGAPAGVSALLLQGMLAVQEADDAARRNQRAHRRATDLLGRLGLLQRALLEGGDDRLVLDDLGALLEAVPDAADPHLGEVLHAVTLRARIELARRRPEAPPPPRPPR